MSLLASVPEPSSTTVPAGVLPAHVVLLTNFIPPYRLPLYRELAARVARLTVLISTPMESNRAWQPDWEGLDVHVQRTWSIHRPWRHQAGFRERLQIHLPLDTLARLQQLRPDIVLSAELGVRSLLSARYRHLVPRSALVLWATVSEHTEQGRGWIRHRLRHWLLRRADRLIVNGASGERYVRRFGVPQARIDRIPYTAVPGWFERVGLERTPAQAHRLLFVGQLTARKGLLPFLDALARWARQHPDRRLHFQLAGSGPLQDTLLHRPLPPNLNLQLLGQLDYQQLAAAYGQAGILVFPSLADEWGLVVNEALAAGLPVLGSRYSQAVEELCVEGQTGWLFLPDDPRGTHQALDRALSTPVDTLNAMRHAARVRAQTLTCQAAAERLVESLRAAWRRNPAREV